VACEFGGVLAKSNILLCSRCEESYGWTARYLEWLRVNPTDSNVVSSYAAQLYQLISWWMLVQVKVLESGICLTWRIVVRCLLSTLAGSQYLPHVADCSSVFAEYTSR
ncbi:hypothetical protein EAH_00068640, partial [Eimeria acervulina]